jgi:stage III sporulation protein AF
MIASVRNWLTAVVAVSVLVSAVQSLIPEGTIRKIASLTGGLLLIIVMLQPLTKLQLGQLRLDYGSYSDAIEERQAELQEERDQELAELIAERTEAYISDKAETLGFSCTAEVKTAPGSDGVPCPYSVTVSCAPSAELADYMAEELGIPKERQIFHGTGEKK